MTNHNADAAPRRGASIEDLEKLDIRVGRVVEADPLQDARTPAMAMRIDFGADVGILSSSAQITAAYTPESLVGKLVMGVVNLPPRRVAGFASEALTLGVYANAGEGPTLLITPDAELAKTHNVTPGDSLG